MKSGKYTEFIKSILINKVKWFEKRVGLDLMYYIRGAPYLIVLEGVIILCGLFSSIAFAWLVPKETYGGYIYVLSMIGLFAIFSISGMNTAIIRAVSKGFDRVFLEGTKIRLKWSLLGSLALLGLGFFYYSKGDIILGKCFLISAFFFPFYSSMDTFLSFFQGKRLFNKFAFSQSFITIISTAIVIAVLFTVKDLFWIIISYLLTYSLLRLYFWKKATKEVGTNDEMDKESLRYGKLLTLQGMIPAIAAQLDMIIIANFLSLDMVAIYAIALYGFKFATFPRGVIERLFFPKVAALDRREATSAVLRNTKYILLLSLVMCGIFAFLLPLLIPLFYSHKYFEAIFYAQILLASELTGSAGGVFTQTLKAQGRAGDLFKLGMITSILEIVLLIILVPYLGLLGAVLVRIMHNLSRSIISFILLKKG